MKIKIVLTACFVACSFIISHAQENNAGEIRGDFQTDFQIYQSDSVIGAPPVPEKFLMNSYLNLVYHRGNFSAGVRYEAYYNALLGFDPRYKGSGFASRWATYKHKDFEITAGNFYEQFGSGILFRSYEDRNLGMDNSIDGIRIVYSPFSGIYLKGIAGQHRYFFDKGQGIVRGADAEFQVNEMREKWGDKDLKLTLGGSFVSKYQQDRDPIYNLPENVAAFSGRMNVRHKKKNLSAEYAYKINDPSAVNRLIYREGQALILNASYATKGFSVIAGAKRIDNMNFRSDRNATGNVLQINYLPSLTKPHAFALTGYYPYATQPNGEMAVMGQVAYKIPKKTKLGGEYGADLSLNFSRVHDVERMALNDTTNIGQSGTLGYTTPFFAVGEELFFQDINLSFGRRLNKNLRLNAEYVYIIYNTEVIEGHDGDMVHAHVGVIDMSLRMKNKRALRWEVQHMFTEHDKGNWAMLLLEYTIAPKWSFGVQDIYNYGNSDAGKRIHYYLMSMAYTHNSSRLAISYGKQREGIVCVGGVCRNVPASNGLSVSVSTNF
jgi:hypothetical protein